MKIALQSATLECSKKSFSMKHLLFFLFVQSIFLSFLSANDSDENLGSVKNKPRIRSFTSSQLYPIQNLAFDLRTTQTHGKSHLKHSKLDSSSKTISLLECESQDQKMQTKSKYRRSKSYQSLKSP